MRIKAINEPYKLEILSSILQRTPDATITIYHIGAVGDPNHWWDLCAGPHVESTGAIHPEAFDLENVAGGVEGWVLRSLTSPHLYWSVAGHRPVAVMLWHALKA